MTGTKLSTIEQFACRHRVKAKRDECGETIILGKKGQSHIFEYDEGVLGVAVMPAPDQTRTWNCARKAFLEAGMTITQDADREGIATFDPDNQDQVRLAKHHAGISSRKAATPAQLAALSGYRGLRAAERQRQRIAVSRGDDQAVLDAGRAPLSGTSAARRKADGTVERSTKAA